MVTIPLVVGIEVSETSLEAVDWAADEALGHDVPLRLLHTAATDEAAPGPVAVASERARKSAPAVRLRSTGDRPQRTARVPGAASGR